MKRWVAVMLGVGVAWASAKAVYAQDTRTSLDDAIRGYEQSSHASANGVVEDWSTHRVVFSDPPQGSAAESKVQRDSRYWMQKLSTHMTAASSVDEAALSNLVQKFRRRRRSKKIARDWSVSLGSGGSTGAGDFPAKFSFTTNGTPNCTSDFVVFNTGLAGSGTHASIVAFNNLYKSPTCTTGTVPSTYWAYNTGGTIVTSPVLSYPAGDQVAFVQSVSGVANLVVLKWKATGSTITTLTSNSSYPNCTAPCMIQIPFNGNRADTLSSPFWDQASDSIFVGDAGGVLHKFSPVFNPGGTTTTPVEVTTGGFPITVSQSTTKQALASPVYDSGTKQIFVGDGHAAGASNDGEVHAIATAGGTATLTNSQATICHGIGYADPPLLDPSASRVYFACGNDQGGGNCSAAGVGCIRQFAENFASGSAGTGEPLGTSADAHIFPGAFDNIYLSAVGPTGNLYVCGNPGGAPTLYRVPLSNNVMGTPVTVATLTGATTSATCSPVTEFYNTTTSTDWLFLSVSASGNRTGCTGACVYSFNATSALSAGTNANAGMSSAGGSSGIIVDNSGGSSSTVANVYYSTLSNQACGTGGTGGCAVQATQSGLL